MTHISGPTTDQLSLKDFGWSQFFQSQLTEAEFDFRPARVMAVHRDALEVASPSFEGRVLPPRAEDDEDHATVGDWLLLDQGQRVVRVLPRRSLFKRKSAGTGRRVQLIAANVDTLFIVTSANADFNIARLERYLALAVETEVTPVVVITKADLTDDVQPYLAKARRLLPGLIVEAFDARTDEAAKCLVPWAGRGQTLALVGSSGVGKSTIVNSLSGESVQETRDIREDDARGRHTTTGRSLHRLKTGAWLMDTPGMRILKLVDAADGIDELFDDVTAIAGTCRFRDCTHGEEPGCAVTAAIAGGALDEGRLKRYQKLQREERRNSESIAEAHARSQKFGRLAKRSFADKLKRREWQ